MKETNDNIQAIMDEDSSRLREISARTLSRAVLEQDRESAQKAVVYYALSKMMNKTHFKKEKKWDQFKKKMSTLAETGDADKTIEKIKEFDEKYGNYLTNVIEKAKMKHASTAYALGLSLSTACELTGANIAEVSSYIGQTRIHERPFTQTKTVRQRLKNAQKLLEE